ncbi:ABC transporter permease [Thermoleophilia bacterium SCSIO 60948]|nr:ABC transporter permease [Thermoleophilia bacterium SCSIO 60948]
MSRESRAFGILAPLAAVLVLLGAWELAARWDVLSDALGIEPFLIPAPSEVAEALWVDRSLLAEDSLVTAVEIVLGLAIALLVGLGAALALHASTVLRRAFLPLLIASQTIPIIAIAPILVVWFDYGIGPKLAIVALICFFPITVNGLDGLRSVDPGLRRTMLTLRASPAQILRRVELPSALPFVFSGLRIAAVVAVIGAVFAEWAGSSSGLGHLILTAQGQLQTARVFAAIVCLSALALALYGAIALAERLICPWAREEEIR